MRRLLAVLLAALMWVGGAPMLPAMAAAAAPAASDDVAATAAILPVVVEGELSETDRLDLTARLVDGLERGDFALVKPAEVLKIDSDAAGCAKARCYKAIASSAKATHIVRTRVEVVDRDYTVYIELFDGSTGESVAKTEEGCEICGVADAGGLVTTAAASLRTKLDALARGPALAVLSSDPPGAEVRIDGEIVGTTPLERPVIPGKRVVRVTKEGYIAVEREVTFVEGVSEKIPFALEKVPSRLPSRPWGWVSLGVGIAALGGAVTFAVLDDLEVPYRVGGRCDGAGRDADGNCEFVWNAAWHTLGLGVAGASLTTLGIAILVNSRARKRESGEGKAGKRRSKKSARRAKRPRLGISPTSVSLSGRF